MPEAGGAEGNGLGRFAINLQRFFGFLQRYLVVFSALCDGSLGQIAADFKIIGPQGILNGGLPKIFGSSLLVSSFDPCSRSSTVSSGQRGAQLDHLVEVRPRLLRLVLGQVTLCTLKTADHVVGNEPQDFRQIENGLIQIVAGQVQRGCGSMSGRKISVELAGFLQIEQGFFHVFASRLADSAL